MQCGDNDIYEEIDAGVCTNKVKLESNGSYGCVKKSSDDSTKGQCLLVNSCKKNYVAIGLTFATIVVLLGVVAASTAFALVEISKFKSEKALTSQAVLHQRAEMESMWMNFSLEMMKHQQLLRDLTDSFQQSQNNFSDEIIKFKSEIGRAVVQQGAEFYTTLESAKVNTSLEVTMYQQLIRDMEEKIQQLQSLSNTTAEMVATFDARMVAKLDKLVLVSNTTHQQLKNSISAIYSTLDINISTCDELPESLSAGYYELVLLNGTTVSQYCPPLTTRCGQTGRWRSVANLNMTNSTHQCFSGFRQTDYSGKRLCERISDNPECSSVLFPSGYTFESVCGLVRAYQYATTDGFTLRPISHHDPYVDGVSITHGSPRQHIWTFAATRSEDSGRNGCPCMGGSNRRPTFVGNDYFCDTGTSTAGDGYVFYGDDPLWDGAGCGPTNNCCSFNTPPWFYKELPQYTDDDIELRVCCDYTLLDEDIVLEAVTIYIK